MADNQTTESKTRNLTTPILIVLLVVVAFLAGSFWQKSNLLAEKQTPEQTQKLVQASPTPEQSAVLGEQLETTVGNFQVTGEEVCLENGKPVVYYFGQSYCPHCKWEHPVFEKVTKLFAGQIVFHDNMDKADADQEVFAKYNSIHQGGIPFIVLGCQYVRVGSGELLGDGKETQALTELLCRLTNNQPAKVCAPVPTSSSGTELRPTP